VFKEFNQGSGISGGGKGRGNFSESVQGGERGVTSAEGRESFIPKWEKRRNTQRGGLGGDEK